MYAIYIYVLCITYMLPSGAQYFASSRRETLTECPAYIYMRTHTHTTHTHTHTQIDR